MSYYPVRHIGKAALSDVKQKNVLNFVYVLLSTKINQSAFLTITLKEFLLYLKLKNYTYR